MIHICLCTICGKEFRPFFSEDFVMCNECYFKKEKDEAK